MKLIKVVSNSIVIIGLFIVYTQYERTRSRNRFYSSDILGLCPRNRTRKKNVLKSILKCKDDTETIVCLNSSEVSNQGVFANKYIKRCNVIGIGIENIKNYFGLNYTITNLGRKINHCHNHANVYLREDQSKNNYLIIALKDIKIRDELYLNYRYLPYYIHDSAWYFKNC